MSYEEDAFSVPPSPPFFLKSHEVYFDPSSPTIHAQRTSESCLSTDAVLHKISSATVQHSYHHLSSFHGYTF